MTTAKLRRRIHSTYQPGVDPSSLPFVNAAAPHLQHALNSPAGSSQAATVHDSAPDGRPPLWQLSAAQGKHAGQVQAGVNTGRDCKSVSLSGPPVTPGHDTEQGSAVGGQCDGLLTHFEGVPGTQVWSNAMRIGYQDGTATSLCKSVQAWTDPADTLTQLSCRGCTGPLP